MTRITIYMFTTKKKDWTGVRHEESYPTGMYVIRPIDTNSAVGNGWIWGLCELCMTSNARTPVHRPQPRPYLVEYSWAIKTPEMPDVAIRCLVDGV